MELPSIDQQNVIIGLLAGILGFMFKRERELGAISSTLKSLEKDIDGIALFVGTPRALSKQKEKGSK